MFTTKYINGPAHICGWHILALMLAQRPIRWQQAAYTWLRTRGDARLARLAARNGAKPKPAHLLTGERGEDAAFFWLRAQGLTLVARRWTDGLVRSDVDLVAWEQPHTPERVLVLIEVKTRSTRGIVPASFAVDRPKQRQLRLLARALLRSFPRDLRDRIPVRFDVVSVYVREGAAMQFERLAAAFPLEEPYRRTGWRL